MNKLVFASTALTLALGAAALVSSTQAPHNARPAAGPEYTQNGELKRPEGYRTWVFVGADLGLEYKNEARATTAAEADRPPEDFHNVYIAPEAYEHYAKTGKFPDKTVLAMDRYAARQKEPQHIVDRGHYEAEQLGVEVAVKNSRRPDGSKTVWAYYVFAKKPDGALSSTAKAMPDQACYNCHLKHADDDSVWVQFYPTLRMLKQKR